MMCSQHIIWGEHENNMDSSVLLMNCSENCFSMHDLFWFPRLLYKMLRQGVGGKILCFYESFLLIFLSIFICEQRNRCSSSFISVEKEPK